MNKTKEASPPLGVRFERRVRVVINMFDYPEKWPLTQSAFEMWVIGKLKNAGIPIKGTLVFRGLERGSIARFDDVEKFWETILEWNPNA